MRLHDDVIKWKHFPRYWPFVRGIHRSPMKPPHKGQWHGALMFSLICAWTNGWVNNGEADDLRRHRTHYYVMLILHNSSLDCRINPWIYSMGETLYTTASNISNNIYDFLSVPQYQLIAGDPHWMLDGFLTSQLLPRVTYEWVNLRHPTDVANCSFVVRVRVATQINRSNDGWVILTVTWRFKIGGSEHVIQHYLLLMKIDFGFKCRTLIIALFIVKT